MRIWALVPGKKKYRSGGQMDREKDIRQLHFEDSDEIKHLISERIHWQDSRTYYLLKTSEAQVHIEQLDEQIAKERTMERAPYGRTYTALDIPTPKSLTDRINEVKKRVQDLLWAYETGER